MDSNSVWPETGPDTAPVAADQPLPIREVVPRNPPWSGWDVTRIALLLFVVPFVVVLPSVAFVANKLLYPALPWIAVAQKPWIALSTQFVWDLLILAYMIMFVEGTFHRRFWEAIQWNWPRWYWALLLVLVGILTVSLEGLERFFKIPKHIPMEEFLNTPQAALMTAIFAVTLGPLMEELFFRGFLYPTLARRSGVTASVLVTAAAFGLIHGWQLAFTPGLVFIIFLVGLVLTIVRAKTNSVGSSFVVHIAYNSTIVAMGIIAAWHGDKVVR
jgi:membrane protease YdiL (CAAX protease family)